MIAIFYTANWCGVCKSIKPMVDSLCKELDVKLYYSDTSDEKGAALAASKEITLLPTIDLIGEKGELRDRIVGGLPLAQMKDRFIGAMR